MIYGGVKYTRVRHAIFCKLCRDTIESKGVHEFKYCSCGAIAIDDDRVLGNPHNIETRHVYCATVFGKRIWLPEYAYLNIDNMYNQNVKVKGRESKGNGNLAKEATEGGSSS